AEVADRDETAELPQEVEEEEEPETAEVSDRDETAELPQEVEEEEEPETAEVADRRETAELRQQVEKEEQLETAEVTDRRETAEKQALAAERRATLQFLKREGITDRIDRERLYEAGLHTFIEDSSIERDALDLFRYLVANR